MSKHLMVQHPTQNRYCDECDFMFESITMKDYLKMVHIHKSKECPSAKERRREVDIKQCNCNKCFNKFNSEEELQKHLRNYHGEENLELSPAQKKTKLSTEVDQTQINSSAVQMYDEIIDNVKQLKIIDIEIDESKRRSINLDKKVLEKRKRDEQEEEQYEEIKREKERKLKAEQNLQKEVAEDEKQKKEN